MSNRYRADYHLHSNNSPDSKAEMESICAAAVRRGFQEIAITDHFECYTPTHPRGFFTERYLQKVQADVQRCREQFEGQLIIRQGIEIGQPGSNPALAAEIMEKFQFDYVIGSLHKMHDLDLGMISYREQRVDELCQRYLSFLYDLVDLGDFDCLGHIDLIKRYAARQGIPLNLCDYPEQLDAILEKLIARGKGLEINTSGLRQEAAATLPGYRTLRRYRELGGEIITIGSDAHRPEDVGADWGEAADLALQAGFTHYATFENRKPIFHKLHD